MKKFYFREKVSQFFKNIKQISLDKKARERFLYEIQIQIQDPRSNFNKYELKCNEDFTAISTLITIPENYQIAATDIEKYHKLLEYARPISQYILNDLNWGDYFLNPEFYYLDNVEDDQDSSSSLGEVSCTYLATWKYEPILNSFPKFKYELLAFVGINVLLLIGLIIGLIILI